MNADLVRNALKLAVATVITAALAVRFERLEYAWYPLLAVLIVVDDNDDHTVQAASARILGTVTGCLITFLVHSIASGWPGVLLALVLMVPVLRSLGWQSALGTAGLIPIVFLMIPGPTALNWTAAFNRALDASVGCAVALAVGLIIWPTDGLRRLRETEAGLLLLLQGQLAAYRSWLAGRAPRPSPLPPAPLSAGLERMETLLRQELAGPRGRALRAGPWRRRVALWQGLRLHWVQWERLLAASALPPPPPGDPDPLAAGIEALADHLDGGTAADPAAATLEAWTRRANQSGRPLLLLLALGQEQRPLLTTSRELAGLRRDDQRLR